MGQKQKTEDVCGFQIRGVIEGFYGKPWTFQQRCELLARMQLLGMNSYFYAAKFDAYHRERWAELYQPEDCEKLSKLTELAREEQIDFWYCIAPGLTLCYSDPGDMDRLMAKVQQMYVLGVRHFGLLLDDIPAQLQYPQDVGQYATLINAHISFINRFATLLQTMLPEAVRLCVCPWQYCGTGEEPYISLLGKNLSTEVKILWTGPQICSETLETQQAKRFIKATGHRPLYWDNYPVNDNGMYREMHLGPLRGRDATLYNFCNGYLCNGMESFECTKIVLNTVADYLRDPVRYDPETSWRASLQSELKEEAVSFRLFADNMRHSCLQETNSQILHNILFEMRKALMIRNTEEAAEILAKYVAKLDVLENRIEGGRLPEALLRELEPWLQKHRKMHRVLHLTTQYLQTPSCTLARWIWDEIEAMKQMTVDYADSGLEWTLGELLRKIPARE
ncbi:MAG: protein O-GlcNAcase [Eubacteriales bacterium]|nr:protein O-GlcNAcase [Eubacteriales bacterium]